MSAEAIEQETVSPQEVYAALHALHRKHLDARGKAKCTKCRAADGSPVNYPCATIKLVPSCR